MEIVEVGEEEGVSPLVGLVILYGGGDGRTPLKVVVKGAPKVVVQLHVLCIDSGIAGKKDDDAKKLSHFLSLFSGAKLMKKNEKVFK